MRLAVRELDLESENSGQCWFLWPHTQPRPSRPVHALIDWLEVGAGLLQLPGA